MVGKLSLVFLACLAVSVIGQDTSCTKTGTMTSQLLTGCLNEIRLDSGVYFRCRGSSEKLRALKSNPQLQAAAQAHARDMSTSDYFSHSSRDGRSPSDRAKAQGYSGSVGENIAWNYNTVYKAMDEWLCSSGHRANILSCKYDEVGSGVYCGGNGCYSVQKFGCSTGFDCCETAQRDPPPASTVPSPMRSPSPPAPIEDSPPSSPDTPMPPRSPPSIPMEPSPPVDPPSSPGAPMRPRSPPPAISTPLRSPDESPMASEAPTPSDMSPPVKSPRSRYRYPRYRNRRYKYNPWSRRYGRNRYRRYSPRSRYGRRRGRRYYG